MSHFVFFPLKFASSLQALIKKKKVRTQFGFELMFDDDSNFSSTELRPI